MLRDTQELKDGTSSRMEEVGHTAEYAGASATPVAPQAQFVGRKWERPVLGWQGQVETNAQHHDPNVAASLPRQQIAPWVRRTISIEKYEWRD